MAHADDHEQFVSDEQQAQVIAGAVNEHRQVAVSFVEFSGPTSSSRPAAPTSWPRGPHRLAGSIADICERFGVFLLATDVNHNGGKFMLAAGAPLSLWRRRRADAARRA